MFVVQFSTAYFYLKSENCVGNTMFSLKKTFKYRNGNLKHEKNEHTYIYLTAPDPLTSRKQSQPKKYKCRETFSFNSIRFDSKFNYYVNWTVFIKKTLNQNRMIRFKSAKEH